MQAQSAEKCAAQLKLARAAAADARAASEAAASAAADASKAASEAQAGRDTAACAAAQAAATAAGDKAAQSGAYPLPPTPPAACWGPGLSHVTLQRLGVQDTCMHGWQISMGM